MILPDRTIPASSWQRSSVKHKRKVAGASQNRPAAPMLVINTESRDACRSGAAFQAKFMPRFAVGETRFVAPLVYKNRLQSCGNIGAEVTAAMQRQCQRKTALAIAAAIPRPDAPTLEGKMSG